MTAPSASGRVRRWRGGRMASRVDMLCSLVAPRGVGAGGFDLLSELDAGTLATAGLSSPVSW